MSTTADILLKSIIGTKLTQQVEDLKYKTENLSNTMEDTSTSVSNALLTFTTTLNIEYYISHFKENTNNFVLRLDESYADNSNFLDSLYSFFEDYSDFQNNEDLLNALDISDYTEIANMKCLPFSFINWMGDTLLKSLVERIYDEYEYPEFLLGTNLSIIYYNALSLGTKSNITNAQTLIQQLLTIDIDAGQYLQDIYTALYSIYIGTNGEINYSRFSNYMTSLDMEHIRQVVKACTIVLKNSMTNVSKVYKDYQLPSFIQYIS